MRPVLAWVAAAVAAVAVASWGVALVGRSVTGSRPEPLSAAQVEDRLATTTTTTSAAPAPTSPTTTVAPGTGEPARGTPSTTVAAGAPTTAPPAATTAPAAVGETRTYALVGGTASLRFEPTGVTVVFANPAPGFDVEQEVEHGNGVRVEFESEGHRSRVSGWWDGGPRDRREEQPDGGDGDDADADDDDD